MSFGRRVSKSTIAHPEVAGSHCRLTISAATVHSQWEGSRLGYASGPMTADRDWLHISRCRAT